MVDLGYGETEPYQIQTGAPLGLEVLLVIN